MSSSSSEVRPGGNFLPLDTAEYQRQQMETELLIEMSGHTGPKKYAWFANGQRDIYFKFGDPENMWTALNYYKKALETVNQDEALMSWIMCKKLGLYKYEYDHGRFDQQTLMNEINLAMETAKGIPFRDRRQRNHDLWWLHERQAELQKDAIKEGASDGEEITLVQRPELIGGIAIELAMTNWDPLAEIGVEDWPLLVSPA